MYILKQASSGVPVASILREHKILSATFYKRRSRYGVMDLLVITKLQELESENTSLKKICAKESLKADILKEVLEKKGKEVISRARDG